MSQTDLHHASAIQAASSPTTAYVLVPPPEYELIPLTGAVVILAGMIIAALFSVRLKRSVAEQLAQITTAIAAADARVAALAGRIDEQSRSVHGNAPTSYNVAIRLTRSGASRQEIMTTCGVTQQEADLLLRLHTPDPKARSAA